MKINVFKIQILMGERGLTGEMQNESPVCNARVPLCK